MRSALILIIVDEYNSTVYEFERFMGLVCNHKNYIKIKTIDAKKVRASDMQNADGCIFIRSMSVIDYELAKLAKKHGKYVALLLDDDFLSLPNDYGINQVGIWNGRKKSLKKMLDYIDGIMTSNIQLGEKYSIIGRKKKYIHLDTMVEKESLIKPMLRKNNITRILLYCNDGTTVIFDQIIRPVIKLLAEARPGEFELDLISLHPDLSEYEKAVQINYIPHMPYPEFRKFINERHYSIGLAPISDDEFSKYKYCNKYIEFTRIGAVGIYSYCDIYKRVIVSGANGILTSNDANAWFNNIIKLHEDDKFRVSLAEEAQKKIMMEFSFEAISEKLVNGLPELFINHENISSVKSIELVIIHLKHYYYRLIERLYLFQRYLQIGGIKAVLKAVKGRISMNREKSR